MSSKLTVHLDGEWFPLGVLCTIPPGSLWSLQCILYHSQWLHIGNSILPHSFFPLDPCPLALPEAA